MSLFKLVYYMVCIHMHNILQSNKILKFYCICF